MIASFSVSGLVPISAAMAGSDVAMTVEVHVFHEQGRGDDQWNDAFFVHQIRGKEEKGGRNGL